MSMRVEYVNPFCIQFMNELDLAEQASIEDPQDRDLLVLNYDEIVVIPGSRDEQLALANNIVRIVSVNTDEHGRARRFTDQDVAANQGERATPDPEPVQLTDRELEIVRDALGEMRHRHRDSWTPGLSAEVSAVATRLRQVAHQRGAR